MAVLIKIQNLFMIQVRKIMIDIVYWGDDWIALYRNKKKILEGHSFYPRDVVLALEFKVQTHQINPESEQELWDGPPDYFKDINV